MQQKAICQISQVPGPGLGSSVAPGTAQAMPSWRPGPLPHQEPLTLSFPSSGFENACQEWQQPCAPVRLQAMLCQGWHKGLHHLPPSLPVAVASDPHRAAEEVEPQNSTAERGFASRTTWVFIPFSLGHIPSGGTCHMCQGQMTGMSALFLGTTVANRASQTRVPTSCTSQPIQGGSVGAVPSPSHPQGRCCVTEKLLAGVVQR